VSNNRWNDNLPLDLGGRMVYPIYRAFGIPEMGCHQYLRGVSGIFHHGCHFTFFTESLFSRQVVALFGGHVLRVPYPLLWVFNFRRKWLHGTISLTDSSCRKWQHYSGRPYFKLQKCGFWLSAFRCNFLHILVNRGLEAKW